LKKLILIFLLGGLSLSTRAQYSYAEWGIGGGYGTTKGYTDLKQNDTQHGYYVDLIYNYSPFFPFAFEFESGKLSGGNNLTDPSHRYFVNNYLAFNVHGDLQLGEIMDYEGNFFLERLKGLSIGTGLGAIFNNIGAIRRTATDDPNYIYPGKNHTINALIPLRFGYEIKIFGNDAPMVALDVNYIHNFTFAEGLDGYSDPGSKFKNNAQDMFRQITVGLKVFFGNQATYIKSIR